MTKELLKRTIYLILVLIWMIIVFMFSNQEGEKSQGLSQEITKSIVQIFTYNQEITENEKEEIINKLDFIIRKIAHYSIYAVGGILIYNYIVTINKTISLAIIISILLGIIYAAIDEFHQYFIDGRSAKILDIVIDSLGVFTGVIIMYKIKTLNKNPKGEK